MPPPSPGTHVSSYASPHTWHTCILVCLPSVRACERANICAACERACVCVCPCEHACICACLHNCMCVCARALRACVCECLPASMHGCVRMCVRVTTGMSTCVAPPPHSIYLDGGPSRLEQARQAACRQCRLDDRAPEGGHLLAPVRSLDAREATHLCSRHVQAVPMKPRSTPIIGIVLLFIM